MASCPHATPALPVSEQRSASLAEETIPLRERLFDVPWDVPRGVWYGRLAALAVVAVWGTAVLLSRMTDPPVLLHLTVILFHEAGHVLFAPFGEAAVSLQRRGDNFGAAICLAWMSMSGMDASVYAYDAADPVLPLIGGGTGADSFHDFVFLFERYGQLDHARGWARAMKTLAALGLFTSLAWAGVLVYLQSEHLEER
jgi:hypothetical protein